MNTVHLIGKFYGRHSKGESKEGKQWIRFTVGVWNPWKKKIDFVRCVAFGHKARICAKFIGPKVPVGITGSLRPAEWEKDGVKHYEQLVTVVNFDFPCAAPRYNDEQDGQTDQSQEDAELAPPLRQRASRRPAPGGDSDADDDPWGSF